MELDIITHGKVKVDISFGGAFYAFVPAQRFDLDVRTSKLRDIVEVATEVSNAVKEQVIGRNSFLLLIVYTCTLAIFLGFCLFVCWCVCLFFRPSHLWYSERLASAVCIFKKMLTKVTLYKLDFN